MLRKASHQVAYCYQRAIEFRERSTAALDETAQQELLEMEQRWLRLARSYERSRRITDLIHEIERSLKLRIKPSQPALRQICPACGEHMWLADVEPALTESCLAETLTVSCACGYSFQRTRTRPESPG
jgi:RNase P subunit RPR2